MVVRLTVVQFDERGQCGHSSPPCINPTEIELQTVKVIERATEHHTVPMDTWALCESSISPAALTSIVIIYCHHLGPC